MRTKSIRISEEMLAGIELVERREKIEEATAIRKLIRVGFETYITDLYRLGRISLRQAAKRLNMNQIDTMDMFLDAGVGGNLGASDVCASMDTFLRKGNVRA